MAIAYEKNTDLGVDTDVLREAAKEYAGVAVELRGMATKLDALICQLQNDGWTTSAGKVFYEMTQTNWEQNIEKYAALLDTLDKILVKAASEYDDLIVDHIRETKADIDGHGGGGGRRF